MKRERSPAVRLSDLQPGHKGDFYALLSERTRGTTREGKDYFHCRFRDLRRTVSVMVWADSEWFADCEANWQPGQFYKVRGTYNEHERYGPQVELERIRPVADSDKEAGFDALDFVERSRRPPADLFTELRELAANQIADEPLRRLVLALLDEHAERWQRLPATARSLLPLRRRSAGAHPGGDAKLSGAGGSLPGVVHRAETASEPRPGAGGRDPARGGPGGGDGAGGDDSGLLGAGPAGGALVLGRDLVRDKARELGDLNPELLQLLEHLLLSYLALPEWGSPRLPLIPECLIVHHADDLDAKLEMYVRCLTRDQAEGPFTDRDPVLNRQLLKGRTL